MAEAPTGDPLEVSFSVAPVIGVLIPAHNEASVIARRLRNLAREAWPELSHGREHRVLVVSDHSSDDTLEVARRTLLELEGSPEPSGDAHGSQAGAVRYSALANPRSAGKAQAIAAGLTELSGVDLVVLTDADVVQRPGSLAALVEAFGGDSRLGLACGAQEFVVDLDAGGRPLAADGGDPKSAAGAYDRVTALVRRIESRGGRLFSVHGQLLAWPTELGLLPRPGIAADDLDLMFQVRSRAKRVGLVPGARFLEPKLPPGAGKREQELRRARAYFQVLANPGDLGELDWLSRVHLAAYGWLPRVAPELYVLSAMAICVTLSLGFALLLPNPWVGLPIGLGLGWFLLSRGLPRRLRHLVGVIRGARAEPGAVSGDRWGTVRT